MREVLLERAPAGGGQAVFRARHARRERFLDGDVLRVLELARVHAEVAVGRLQQALEIGERQAFVDRQRADDAQPEAFVDEAIEAERSGLGARDSGLAVRDSGLGAR